MGLLKGTATFTRYRVVGDLPGGARDFIDERLKRFAFRASAAATEEKTAGWTSITQPLNTRFEYADYASGEYLVFSLRIDRKTVPPSLLRFGILEAEEKILAAQGRKRLSRAEREDVAERVRLELLGKAFSVPSVFDVCWCLSRQWLIFGSHADKEIEIFEDLFKRTFQLNLAPVLPWDGSGLSPETAGNLALLERAVFVPVKRGGQ